MSQSGNPNEAYWAKKFIAGAGSATIPSISFNTDPDTGLFSGGSGTIQFTSNGTSNFYTTGTALGGATTGAGGILNETSSAVNPTITPNIVGDTDTGLGWSAADSLSLIAGAIEGFRLTEASSKVIVSAATSANVGLTADAGSAQGNGVILASYNVYDTVGVAGDAATLPAVFEVGTLIYVKNGAAANSMDVFPASGDDLGAGANTAVAIAAGNFKVFMGTTANATWEQIMGGTA